jgi:hypothetical protein
MKNKIILLWFITAFSFNAFSQDNLADYKRAQTLIGYGNYGEAMQLLKPYMDESQFGVLSLYAKYHFAYAAYQSQQYELGKSILITLIQEKNWKKSDEARYLLALHLFQEKEFRDALAEIEAIKDPEIFKEAENASFEFLEDASVSFLIGNFSKFNRNNGLMLALQHQLEKQTVMSADEKVVLNQIRSQEETKGQSTSKEKNNILDVAIILPFNYNGGSGVNNLNSSNFVFELYQGIFLANEEIRGKGMPVNIRTFDSERSSEKLKKILSDPFFEQADVIIGPIYPEESELVAAFSQRKNIPFFNPLSNIDEKFEGMSNAFLFRPSINSLSNGILEFARKNGAGRRLAIAYSNTSRDEMLAKKLEKEAIQLGFEVATNQQVTDRNIREFFQSINLSRGREASVDMVVILSDDPNIASPTFGLMESLNKSLPIMVMDSWLYFNFANYEMLQTQNFHFIGNNAVRHDANLEGFRDSFSNKFHINPSFNAHLGYELMIWLSENLNAGKGFNLRNNLDQRGFHRGRVTYGFDFKGNKHNTYIPILKLENGVLEEK